MKKECEGCKWAAYFPGCNRECEHHPDCEQAKAEVEQARAKKLADNRAAWDRNVARNPAGALKQAPDRERLDSVFEGLECCTNSASETVKPARQYPVDEYGNILDGSELEGIEIAPRKTYLTNTFSPAMLSAGGAATVQEITLAEAQSEIATGFTSSVGHEVTAGVLTALLGVPVEFARVNLVLNPGDRVVCVIPAFRASEAREFTRSEVEGAGYRCFLAVAM